MVKQVKPHRGRQMPGLSLLLSQLPEDVRRELADQHPLFVSGFAVGWLRCAAERVVAGGPWSGPTESPEEPSPPTPVRPASGTAAAIARTETEVTLPPPPGAQEPSIGHWTPAQVTEVIGFAVVNSTNPTLARTLAVRRLQQWDAAHADLPGSWAAQLLSALEHPADGVRSIRREPSLSQVAQTFDETAQPKGEFAQLQGGGDE